FNYPPLTNTKADKTGVLSIHKKDGGSEGEAIYADRYYVANNVRGANARLLCVDPTDGAIIWSILGKAAPQTTWNGNMAIAENGDVVNMLGQTNMVLYNEDMANPGVWTLTEGYNGVTQTYGRIDADTGVILWTAGEENTAARTGIGPIFGPMDHSGDRAFRGAIALMNLADEGELAVVSRAGPNPWEHRIEEFVVRADSMQNVTVWTAGTGNTVTGGGGGWTWHANVAYAAPVVDSTNNVYLT
ncbi:unnamed protein product, partial [marine sediment metagenome]